MNELNVGNILFFLLLLFYFIFIFMIVKKSYPTPAKGERDMDIICLNLFSNLNQFGYAQKFENSVNIYIRIYIHQRKIDINING